MLVLCILVTFSLFAFGLYLLLVRGEEERQRALHKRLEILENIATGIRDRFRILGQVRVYTAQGRMTGWIIGVWNMFVPMKAGTACCAIV